MIRFLKTFTLVGFFGAGLAQTSVAQDAPDPSQVTIKRVTYSGPGCPAGTVAHNVAPDAKAFTLLFSEFIAEAGPGVPGGRNKTSCRVTVDFRYPSGWTYSLFKVDYRGFVSLESGVSAKKRSTYYFQATPNLATVFEKNFRGPYDSDFQITDFAGMSEIVWSSCERIRAFNIDTEISVSNTGLPDSTGLLTVDSVDGSLYHVYGIRWARCP